MDKHLDQEVIREFYNKTPEIWAKDDYWHLWSRKQISQYLRTIPIHKEDYVLNAGSGGNSYDIECNMLHVDIASQKLVGVPNSLIASIERLPVEDHLFDASICVGSVINYCDAAASISELSRVLKPGGTLVLEFESSSGYEYLGSSAYCKAADIVTVQFQGQDHTQWLYSLPYIKALLKSNRMEIEDIYPYHIISSLALKLNDNESTAVKYAHFDTIARRIPFFAKHANNFMLCCRKSKTLFCDE